MSAKQEKIREQIEYYLSDKNLEQDEYFRKEIESGSDGFVNLSIFQKCNKIKKLGVTNEDILNAIKSSGDLETNPEKNSLRRKHNKPLPEFKESNKKVKTDNNSNNHKKNEEKNEEEKTEPEAPKKEEKKPYEPLVFSMAAQSDKSVDWKLIQGELEKVLATKIYYTRFSKDEKAGHFVVGKFDIEEAKKAEILKNGFSIDDVHFKVVQSQEKELESFWKDHGGHYTLCVERKNKDEKGRKKDRKTQKNERKERERNPRHVEISLANRKYNDPSKVKDIFKQLLSSTADGEKIAEPNHTMLKDILKFHESGDKKMDKLDHFTVGVHPEYKTTRCFFTVRSDGTKEDFSVTKCLDAVASKHKK